MISSLNRTLRPFGYTAAVAAGILLGAASPGQSQDASQQSVRIELSQGPGLARQLLRAGQPNAAKAVAEALLQADPASSQAHILLSLAHMQLGDTASARQSARTAWRTAQTENEKYVAAFTMADVLAADEAYTRSQLWVRRAVQAAPNDAAEARAVEAFRRLRQTNPLSVELSFGITPSDNVNSGNSNDTISFAYLPGVWSQVQWTVPPEQRPLSGVEISGQAQIRYRIGETQTSRTSLEFGAFSRGYVLSQDAKQSAPDVEARDFSYTQASFGLLRQWVAGAANQPYSASLTYSYEWAGGDPYLSSWDASIGTQFVLTDSDVVAVSAGVQLTDRVDVDPLVRTYRLSSRWAHQFENSQILALTAQLSNADSDATAYAFDSTSWGISYDFGEVLNGIDLSMSAAQEMRTYESSPFDPAGRTDKTQSLSVNVGLQNIEIYGFEPVIKLTGRQRNSTVDRFDTEGVELGIDFRSSF